MASNPNYQTNQWKGRPEPKRCPFISKGTGQPCKNYCVVGYNCCYFHGGKGALSCIKHGMSSSRVAAIIQGQIKQVNAKLEKIKQQQLAVFSEDTDREQTLVMNQKLSHLMLNEMIASLEELQNRVKKIRDQVDKYLDDGSKSLHLNTLITAEVALQREINSLRGNIQRHQAQLNSTLKTIQELRSENETEETLKHLNSQLLDTTAEEVV